MMVLARVRLGKTRRPSLTGSARQGHRLRVSRGSWSGSPTSYTYAWRRYASTCAHMRHVTGRTYLLRARDVGDRLVATVIAQRPRLGPRHPRGRPWSRASATSRTGVTPSADILVVRSAQVAPADLLASLRRTEVVGNPWLSPVLLAHMRLRAARHDNARALGDWREADHGRQALHAQARAGVTANPIEVLREAVDLLANSPARLEYARALVSLGGSLRRQGQRVDSREPLRAGYELAREGGAANSEIAQELFLTVKTVEMHLTNTQARHPPSLGARDGPWSACMTGGPIGGQ
jgi:hypothetical protein